MNGKKGSLMGPLIILCGYVGIYLYILIGGRRSYERYVVVPTQFFARHAYMDITAHGIL